MMLPIIDLASAFFECLVVLILGIFLLAKVRSARVKYMESDTKGFGHVARKI